MKMRFFSMWFMVFATASVSWGAPIVSNGSFEQTDAQGRPDGWRMLFHRNSPGRFSVQKDAADGGRLLRITNPSGKAVPNVYSQLYQLVPLKPDTDYMFRFRVRGKEPRALTWALGKNWKIRFPINGITEEWQTFSFFLRVPADLMNTPESCELCLITEDRADGVELDDVEIIPMPDAIVRNGDFCGVRGGNVPCWQIGRNRNVNLGAGLDGKGVLTIRNYGFAADGVYGALYQKIKLTPGNSYLLKIRARGTGRTPEVRIGASWKQRVYFELVSTQWRDYTYEFIAPDDCDADGMMGLNVIFNAMSDCSLDKIAIEPAPLRFSGGERNRWTSADAEVAELVKRGEPGVLLRSENERYPSVLFGKLFAIGETGTLRFSAEMTDASGAARIVQLGTVEAVKPDDLLRIPYEIPLAKLPEGAYTLAFRINDRPVVSVSGVNHSFVQRQKLRLDDAVAKLNEINRKFDEYYGDRERSAYVSAPLNILNFSLERLSKLSGNAEDADEKMFYAREIDLVMPETVEALTRMEGTLTRLLAGEKLPATWSYRSSQIRQRNGWPVARAVSSDGREQSERPMVCVGFGHFEQIDKDLKKFQNIGANTVQIELCPWQIFPKKEGESDFSAFEKRYLPFFKTAWENNVSLCLLLSPHVMPGWVSKTYPEVKAKNASGFLGYEIMHPKMIEILKSYLRTVIPRIKSSPYASVIHSICLTNEPVYSSCTPENPYSRTLFTRYFTEKYGTIERFNQIARQNFKDVEALLDAVSNNPAARFEFYTFVRKMFSDWHRMQAEEIRALWPEVPLHSKIMVFGSTFDPKTGVDPELFAEFSDYNGNDNYFFHDYQNDWVRLGLTHEIQISSKPVSVVDSETHLIPDGFRSPTPNQHIYTGIFYHYITGASTLTTWLYEEIDYQEWKKDPNSGANGGIYHRPGNLAAQARAELDGMRLAPELEKFFLYKPEVALFYSPTSILQNRQYTARLHSAYQNFCYTGRRVRTLSEKQLASDAFGKTRLLFLRGATHVSRAAREGMARFVRQGGRIIADQESLRFDEFGNPAAVEFPIERCDDFSPEVLTKRIDETIPPLPFRLAGESNGAPADLFFRAVPAGDGSWLVSVINHATFSTIQAKLSGDGEWFDLIREQKTTPEMTLGPLENRLLRFTPAK